MARPDPVRLAADDTGIALATEALQGLEAEAPLAAPVTTLLPTASGLIVEFEVATAEFEVATADLEVATADLNELCGMRRPEDPDAL